MDPEGEANKKEIKKVRRPLIKGYVVKRTILFALIFVELLLGLRVLLKLLGADAEAIFVNWLYDFSHPLAQPFLGMFPSAIKGTSVEIEFSVIFGMLLYGLVAYLLGWVVDLVEKAKR